MFFCSHLRWTGVTKWRPDGNEQARSGTCGVRERSGRVINSLGQVSSNRALITLLYGSVETNLCLCLVHLFVYTMLLKSIKTREAAFQSNKLFYNVCTQTHTHVCRPLSNLKWGLRSDTLGFTAKDCSYRMGVAVLNESKCPNGKTVVPKWGITKRIWIPPTAHREARK